MKDAHNLDVLAGEEIEDDTTALCHTSKARSKFITAVSHAGQIRALMAFPAYRLDGAVSGFDIVVSDVSPDFQ